MRQIALSLIIILLGISIFPKNVQAEQKILCKDVIKAADTAIQKKDAQIKATNEALTQAQVQLQDLSKKVEEKDQKLSNPGHNTYLFLGLGVAAGVALIPAPPVGAILLGVSLLVNLITR